MGQMEKFPTLGIVFYLKVQHPESRSYLAEQEL